MHNPKPTIHERAVLFLAEPVNAVVAIAFTVALIVGLLTAVASAARSAPEGCVVAVVRSGDTASGIAARHRASWTEFVKANQHIENLNRIWPGDELVVGPCDPDPAPPAALAAASVPIFELAEPGRLSVRGVVQLAATQFSGEEMITMAAITLGESGGWFTGRHAIGDEGLTGDEWGPSLCLVQARTRWDQTGTGTRRDLMRLTGGRGLPDGWDQGEHMQDAMWTDPVECIAAAREFVDVKRAIKRPLFEDWSAWLNGSWKKHLSAVRAAARDLGLVK